jgi:hypothetical protein
MKKKPDKIFEMQLYAAVITAFIIVLVIAKVAIWLVYDVF